MYGNVDLTNVTLSDSLTNLIKITGDNSPTGILDIGETWTYSGNYTVTQADINTNGNGNALIENTATVDCDQLDPKSHTAEVPVKASPAYTIDKTVLDVGGRGPAGFVISAGDVLSYQINVSNVGNVDLTNVTLDEYLFDVASPTGDYEPVGILDVGEIWIYTGSYTVTQEDIDNHGTLIGNFDDIGGADGDMDNNATIDCDQLDPKSHTCEVPLGTPVYIIDKTIIDVAGKGPAGDVTVAGDSISYQINVTNSGNLDLTNITVADSLVDLTEPTGDHEPLGILDTEETWTYSERYKCYDCGYNYSVEIKSSASSTYVKRQALQLYLEGLGFRSIGRFLGVSHVSVQKWIKKFGEDLEDLKSENEISIVELDEMHTYIGNKKNIAGSGLLLIELGKSSSIALLAAEEQKLEN